MTVNQAIAVTTVVGVGVITLDDAPNWKLDPYIGLMAAMAGVSLIGRASPELGKALALLIGSVVVLERGDRALTAITSKFN